MADKNKTKDARQLQLEDFEKRLEILEKELQEKENSKGGKVKKARKLKKAKKEKAVKVKKARKPKKALKVLIPILVLSIIAGAFTLGIPQNIYRKHCEKVFQERQKEKEEYSKILNPSDKDDEDNDYSNEEDLGYTR